MNGGKIEDWCTSFLPLTPNYWDVKSIYYSLQHVKSSRTIALKKHENVHQSSHLSVVSPSIFNRTGPCKDIFASHTGRMYAAILVRNQGDCVALRGASTKGCLKPWFVKRNLDRTCKQRVMEANSLLLLLTT